MRLRVTKTYASSTSQYYKFFPLPCAPNLFHLFEGIDKRKEGENRGRPKIGSVVQEIPAFWTCRPRDAGRGPGLLALGAGATLP